MLAFTRIIWKFQTMRVLLLVLIGIAAVPVQAQQCRQALVLALDVSGSVNPTEYAQQIEGLAAALGDPQVRALILLGADAPVTLAVFEWSSRNHQFVIQPWIMLDSAAALDVAILRIRSHRKVRAGLKTALGSALNVAAGLLREQSHCWKHTIDVSGDGKNNIGVAPDQIYAIGGFDGITVNALVVGDPLDGAGDGNNVSPAELRSYFETQVIFGPNAFAMIANGYADFARAMQRKLMKEISLPMFGQIGDSITQQP